MAHKGPLVSVVIPVYNTGSAASEVVSAVLSQSYNNFELLLINDGSTDNSLDILHALAKKDKRISVINQKNQGPSGARNTGIEKSSGKYIIFIDSDDTISKSTIKKMVDYSETKSSDLVVAGMILEHAANGVISGTRTLKHPSQLIINDGPNFKKKILRSLASDGRLYSLCNKIFYSEIIKSNSLRFNTSLRFGEDLVFVLSYLEHTKSIYLTSDIFYTYKQNTNTSISSKSSLDYRSRQENLKALVKFSKPADSETQELLSLLRLKWGFSYCIALIESKGSTKEIIRKIKNINAEYTESPVKTTTPIAVSSITERLFLILLNYPLLLVFYLKILTLVRSARKQYTINILLPKIQ